MVNKARSAVRRRKHAVIGFALCLAVLAVSCTGPSPGPAASGQYPWHTGIVATTFWVGEIFDPNAADGSQVLSTYDSTWMQDFGGCDGQVVGNGCNTEARTASNGYFPVHMTPKENPFYLDLPYDDVNDATAYAERG